MSRTSNFGLQRQMRPTGPATDELLVAIADAYTRGGGLLFQVVTKVLVTSGGRLQKADDLVNLIVEAPEFAGLVPEVGAIEEHPAVSGFEYCSLDEVRAGITALLATGGYRPRRVIDREEATRIAAESVREICGGSPGPFMAIRSFAYWSAWFRAVTWDCTWIIVDEAKQTFTFLCATDEDR